MTRPLRTLLLFLALLGLAACAHSERVSFDPAEIRPWSEALGKAEPFLDERPFLSVFSRGRKRLYFIAAFHEIRTDSPTFILLRRVLQTYPIQAVIIEDTGPAPGEAPSAYLKRMTEGDGPGYVGRGEPVFAASLALAKGIPFTPGEPRAKDLQSGLSACGYGLNDFLALSFMWQIPSYKRRRVWKKWTPAGAFRHLMQALNEELGLGDGNGFTYEDFLRWHADRNGKPFLPDRYDPEDAAPRADGTLFSQKLAVAAGAVRDGHILEAVAAALTAHDEVLVVYGASHLAELRRSLEKELGRPTLETAP